MKAVIKNSQHNRENLKSSRGRQLDGVNAANYAQRRGARDRVWKSMGKQERRTSSVRKSASETAYLLLVATTLDDTARKT